MLETPLYCLVYSSDAVGSVTEAGLQAILEQARGRNERLGITGLLLYRQGRFVQYLEGAQEDVLAVYESIAADSRHANVRVLLREQVASRRFPSWKMGYEPFRESSFAVPTGFRNSFAEIERSDDPARVLQALGELTLWFHVRAARA